MKQLSKLKTFEDACLIEGLAPKQTLAEIESISGPDKSVLIAHAKLMIIVRAANRLSNNGKPWNPNWSNWNEYKYFPWFEMDGSSGFRFHDDDVWVTGSGVGSRLCFKSREACLAIVEQFIELYRDLML